MALLPIDHPDKNIADIADGEGYPFLKTVPCNKTQAVRVVVQMRFK